MDELQEELRQTFLEEASELLSDAEQTFLQLETTPDDPALIEKIFRLAHNLKGSSRAVGFNDIAEFTHEFESLLLKIKNKETQLESRLIDLLLRANDYLCKLVAALKSGESVPAEGPALQNEIKEVIANNGFIGASEPTVEKITEIGEAEDFPVQNPEVDGPSQQELEQLQHAADLFQEIEAATNVSPIAMNPPQVEKSEPELNSIAVSSVVNKESKENEVKASGVVRTPAHDESIRVSLGRLEKLVNNIGELVILQTVLNQQRDQIASPFIQKTIAQLGKITKDIQDISMGLRMVSLKQTFQKMQRIVRDTSKELGKDIHFELHGEDTELDKTVVDGLGDPLVHLIRNAVDHGIESVEERLASGKPARGYVRLSAEQTGGRIVIEIRDDGKGLDAQKLKQKAIMKGLVPARAELSEADAINLIFKSGFSTKESVSGISGRGVGMDVVKTNVEKVLNGEISVSTELGRGSVFRISLPLTLAIIDSMVVRAGNERYVIPLTQVHESVVPRENDVHDLPGIGEVLSLRGENLPLFTLSQLMGVKSGDNSAKKEETAIVVRTGRLAFAVVVDQIVSRQQVVIKKLGEEVRAKPGISGGAILGDGCAALIIDLPELVNNISNINGRSILKGAAA